MAAPDDPRQLPWLRANLVASWRETLIVLFVFNGYFLGSAIGLCVDHLIRHLPTHSPTNAHLLHLMATEAIMLAAFFALLHHRGWEVADLRIHRDSSGNVLGMGFALTLLLLWGGYLRLLNHFGLLVHHASLMVNPHPHVDFLVILTLSVVNAYYEEILMMAYAFNQFAAKIGPAAATALIVSVRVMYHLWKDPIFLPFTALHFLLSAALYCATRKIWPLILSHAIYDLVLDLPLAHRH